jgi:para-nitrobenzyl esterase
VRTANGVVEGAREENSVRVFKGIPFAQPPVGDLRWKPPQPAKDWSGVRMADKFGPRAMQLPLFGDMVFRSDGMSEDCLYLNVWTPAKSGDERLPVLVYFYGGGFVAGDGSEPRYDGAGMAGKGVVAVTANYRLGVFGFLAHPELTKESPGHASGDYGLMDQAEALRWVRRNIAAFGGDPEKVTIAGESAGSLSVCALMASPLSKRLFAGAVGESGSLMGTLTPVPLAEAEQAGVKFAAGVGAKSLADLRKAPAEDLLKAKAGAGVGRFPVAVDGYFLTEQPADVFAAGKQARVPLLVGWNSEEAGYQGVLGREKPTRDNYAKALKRLYGDRAEEALKVYSASTDAEVEQAAADLASDRFIGYSTWKWADLHGQTGGKPVYRYLFARPRPQTPPARGAVHSAEIEYALGNLATNKVYAWTEDDYKASRVMQGYFANFVKTGDPNGPDLPKWPAADGGDGVRLMRLDVDSGAETERHRERYLFQDQVLTKKPAK